MDSGKKKTWTIAGTIATVVGTVVAIIAVFLSSGTSTTGPTQSGAGNNQANNGGTVVNGDMVIGDQFKDEAKGLGREKAKDLAAKYADVAPTPGQPAQFLIVDTPHHLWVRSSPTADGHHIGAAYNETIVWANCVKNTNFDPELTDEEPGSWLQILWHTDQPNDDLANTDRSDKFVGWVYQGRTVPAGHNGKVPTCS